MKATLTKKRVTVTKSESISGTAPTATLPLWKRNVVVGSTYDAGSTHKFTNNVVPGVAVGDTNPTPTAEDVFTAISHDAAYGED